MVFWMCAAIAATTPTPQSSASTEVSGKPTPTVTVTKSVTPSAATRAKGAHPSTPLTSANEAGPRPLPSVLPMEFKPHNLQFVGPLPQKRTAENLHSAPVERDESDRENVFVLDNEAFPGLQTGLEASGYLCISER